MPIDEVSKSARLTVPFDADEWLNARSQALENSMLQIAAANQAGVLAGGSIVDGKLQIDRLEKSVPAEAAAFVLNLYKQGSEQDLFPQAR